MRSSVAWVHFSRHATSLSYVRPTRLRLYTRHVTWHTLALFFTSFGLTFVLVTAARSTPTRTQRTGSARSRTLPRRARRAEDLQERRKRAFTRCARSCRASHRQQTKISNSCSPSRLPCLAEGSQRGQPLRQPREQGSRASSTDRRSEVRASQNDRVVATRLQTSRPCVRA